MRKIIIDMIDLAGRAPVQLPKRKNKTGGDFNQSDSISAL